MKDLKGPRRGTGGSPQCPDGVLCVGWGGGIPGGAVSHISGGSMVDFLLSAEGKVVLVGGQAVRIGGEFATIELAPLQQWGVVWGGTVGRSGRHGPWVFSSWWGYLG